MTCKTDFVEVKTQDLSGAALDWAVLFANCGDGPDWRLIDGELFLIGLVDVRVGMDGIGQQETIDPFQPSTRWKDGGPLIEKFKIGFGVYSDAFFAVVGLNEMSGAENGSTHLIAACRAIVAANLGDTVRVPKELLS